MSGCSWDFYVVHKQGPVSYLYAHSSLPMFAFGVGAIRGRVKIRTSAGLPVRIGDFEA
jgi:hypothetical protein